MEHRYDFSRSAIFKEVLYRVIDSLDPLTPNSTIESRFRIEKCLQLSLEILNLLKIPTVSQVVSNHETIPDSKYDEDAFESQSKYVDDLKNDFHDLEHADNPFALRF